MGFFSRHKDKDEPKQTEPAKDTFDPTPWLGRVGDGQTLASGERIAREIRELQERRHHPRVDVDAESQISGDPEMPIPDPRKR
jgi:hypothetical protein